MRRAVERHSSPIASGLPAGTPALRNFCRGLGVFVGSSSRGVSMKRSLLVFFLAFSLVCVAAADPTAGKPLQVTEIGKDSFEANFVSGGQLRMHIRSGDLRVIGGNDNKIRVNYSGKNAGKTSDVKVSLKTVGNNAELRISGGPHNDFRIEIQVPKNSGLYLRMPAGDLEVGGITGDKDVEIHAGDMTLGVGKRTTTATWTRR